MFVSNQVVKDAIDQICDVLEVQDTAERDEYTMYVITNSGASIIAPAYMPFCTALDGVLENYCRILPEVSYFFLA